MPYIIKLSNPARYVENEFKRIVDPANIRRMIFFDRNGADTTLKDKSNNKKDATLSLAAASLDPANTGKARVLNFNASGDYWYFEDSDDLSFGNGSTDSAFSIVLCVKPNNMNVYYLLSKSSSLTGDTKNEYNFLVNTNTFYVSLVDNSAGGYIGRLSYNSFATDTSAYHTYIVTYSGSNTNSGIKIYRDAVQIDKTNYSSGSYSAMENLGAKVGCYSTNSSGGKASIANAKYAFVSIVSEELSPSKIISIDTLLRKYVGAI